MCTADFNKITVKFTNNGTTNLIKGTDTVWFGYQANVFPKVQKPVILPATLGPGENFSYSFFNIDSEILPEVNTLAFWTIISGDMRPLNDSLFKNIFVNPSPAPFNLAYNFDGNYGDTIVSNNEVELDPGTYNSYLWQDNKTTTETFFATTKGWYSVTVSNAEGCTLSDSVYLKINKVGLTEYTDLGGRLFVFPVPASSSLNIIFFNSGKEDLNLEIVSAEGLRLFNSHIAANEDIFREQIDISKYQKGIYFIRVFNHNFMNVNKLTIQ